MQRATSKVEVTSMSQKKIQKEGMIFILSSLVKCLFKSFAHFLIKSFDFLLSLIIWLSYYWLYIFCTQVLYQIYALQIFSSSLWFVFRLLTENFEEQRFLILMKSNLSILFLMDCAFSLFLTIFA